MVFTSAAPSSSSLSTAVTSLFQLFEQSPALGLDLRSARASLAKAISPTFEIVFAGAFSAGKSMLINALLGRELLYSAEGHATGTECRIAQAEAGQERVILTFLSALEIQSQVNDLAQQLGLGEQGEIALSQSGELLALRQHCTAIIEREGGESKSELAKQASALRYLLQGYSDNQRHIDVIENTVLSMEQLNFSTLYEAAGYARRGSNSAVLKRVDYFCHHPLLQDGNILIDTPGIDAPVKRDAELTYAKIQSSETSAVICVLKPASAGDLTVEETELLEKTRDNPGVRDRVFYVFNRIDETWYNSQLSQRLDTLIREQFRNTHRIYRTSALLGFYGSRLSGIGMDHSLELNVANRFGLDSLWIQERDDQGLELTPQFVSEFNRYCASSGRLPSDRFRVDVRSYETPNQNYVRILTEQGPALIQQLIQDSGMEEFRRAITRYLTQEKRPQLLKALATDLQPLCESLRRDYQEQWEYLRSQPKDVGAIKEQELRLLGRELQQLAEGLQAHWDGEINEVVASNGNAGFEADFRRLKARLVSRLDELLNTFSVGAVHQRAQASHRRNSVVPLLGILAEAFYYLANGLEEVLVESSEELVRGFFADLGDRVRQQDYYRRLGQLVGHDGGIGVMLERVEALARQALVNEARTECDRYVRERPEFFAEGTASMFQLRQTLMQACLGYDYQNMVGAEAAIRQLLKLDFEEKVGRTVMLSFRQVANQTLNVHLREAAREQSERVLGLYDQAREFLARSLEREAEERIRQNERLLGDLEERIRVYNEAVGAIAVCFAEMGIDGAGLLKIEVERSP